MTTIYLVKSFGHDGYTNLKVFDNEENAEQYAKNIEQQIPADVLESGDEFVEVETFILN